MSRLPEERRARILDRLRRDGRVYAAALSTELKVSEDTIRRDLRDLAAAGHLQRVHGGALPKAPSTEAFSLRAMRQTAAKNALARAAARLIEDGQVVVMDGGTTTLELARELPHERRITVITNSPPIAVELADHPTAQVHMLAGQMNKTAWVVTGAETLEGISRVRADLCILGVCSLDPEMGITTAERQEALLKRRMIDGAAEVMAIVTANKLGTATSFVVAPVSELTHIVTDETRTDVLEAYRATGITVTSAGECATARGDV
ncbi:DeoR/GlpR family DNA-binding transcription regulator [Arhodomonas sp. AD133]|uniref:DeoR/GlpR family DNA-binding transcription regulator n=1 Tax=Arhodomonas sp. AD133 TaxID=3415009 RepID=UPI003EB8F2DF